MSELTWYGHSAFKIACDGVSVLIDPFFAPDGKFTWKDAGAVDWVLITHDHGDHVGDALAICSSCGAMLGCVVGTADKLVNHGLPQSQVLNGIGFNIGGTLSCKGMAVTMTQAFHSSDSGVPTGYIVKMPDGMTFYHAGDTGIFSSMKLLGALYSLDVALLPIGGVFTMDAYQAANACKLLNCRKAVPMHWGTFPVLAQTPEEFAALTHEIAPDCQCMVMERGVTVNMKKA